VTVASSEFPGYRDYFLEVSRLSEGDAAFYCDGTSGLPGWKLFSSPRRILFAEQVDQVPTLLREVSEHKGFTAGFLSYEASPAFDPAIRTKVPTWPVLAWFALYDSPGEMFRELAPCYRKIPVVQVDPELDACGYRERFEEVKQALAEGRSYQVDLTFRIRFGLGAAPHEFFASRCGAIPPRYASFIHGRDWSIASFSPELMFERTGSDILCRPMKGTAIAPMTRPETVTAIEALQREPKSVAENLMIVDMVRNDLGSICETGSIRPEHLFRVERHGQLLQMTSDVLGRTAADLGPLMKALFPPASVTGAPKVSTADLIANLECSPRHVYCGAIAFTEPGHERFSVAIRTALLHRDGTGEFGVGSGIVWDSDPGLEYQECLSKAEFLHTPKPQWTLLEALNRCALSEPETVEVHLSRLAGAASRLGIELPLADIRGTLDALPPNGPPKVRVTVQRDGRFQIEEGESAAPDGPMTAVLATRPVSSNDPNLRFKTSGRGVYETFLNEHPDFDEVLLWNERDEVTEFCRGSVIVEIDGDRLTPPPECGCLESVSVRGMAAKGDVRYRTICLRDLPEADHIWFVNAVTGTRPVRLILRP
jgi:para-aminobenzoate synthetase/4-amino-4-deoxychorismate lyase